MDELEGASEDDHTVGKAIGGGVEEEKEAEEEVCRGQVEQT